MWGTRVEYVPHEKQSAFHGVGAKYRALFCSRRWGKDEATVQEVSRLIQRWHDWPKPGNIIPRIHVWFLSPTYPLSRDWERRFQRVFPVPMRALRSERSYFIEPGIVLEFKSADRPDRLVSVGLDLLCVTEAQLIGGDAISQLRPTLISPNRMGQMLVTGVPAPVPWMEDWKREADDGNPRYWYYTGASSENPHIDAAELQAEVDSAPPHLRGPLYLGEWPTHEGSVFRNLARAISIPRPVGECPLRAQSQTRGPIFDGLDPARLQDYMAYVALERREDGRLWQVAFDRFNKQDWDLQVGRIAANVKQYPYRAGVMDVTGVGDAVTALLRKTGARFEPATFTAPFKATIVNELALALDNDELRLFDDQSIHDEFRRFTYTVNKSGAYSYSAPQGHHDDIVMATALAVHASRKHKPTDPAVLQRVREMMS